MRRSVAKQHQRFVKKTSVDATTPTHSLESLLSILSTPPEYRSSPQVLQIEEYMQSVAFFTDLAKNVGRDALLQCCKCMSQECYGEGEFVFHADDEAEKFYVILSGSVTVLRPDGRVDGRKTYQQLAVVKEGGSFGELALIQSACRSASILCCEPTYLGVLMRQDYLRILGKVQGLLLTKKVNFLQSNPVFAPWSRSSLLKLSYYFKDRTFHRKQVVFHAGDQANEVFLVKSGDFELVKSISVKVKRSLHQLRDNEQMKCQAEVTLVSVGEMLGGLEVIKDTPHRYTCVCYSTQAEVLYISKSDFLKRMTSEGSVNTVISLNDVIESQRDLHIQRISHRERVTRDLSSSIYSFDDPTIPSSILHAKMELEAEVRHRWFLPKLRKKPELGHSVSDTPLYNQSLNSSHKLAASQLLTVQTVRGLDVASDMKSKLVNCRTMLKAIMPTLSLKRKLMRKKAESTTRLATERIIASNSVRD